jgi:hypothetical protein
MENHLNTCEWHLLKINAALGSSPFESVLPVQVLPSKTASSYNSPSLCQKHAGRRRQQNGIRIHSNIDPFVFYTRCKSTEYFTTTFNLMTWRKRVITEVINRQAAMLCHAASHNTYKSFTPFIHSFIHSFILYSYDNTTASSKASSPQSAMYCFLFQFLLSSRFFNIIL